MTLESIVSTLFPLYLFAAMSYVFSRSVRSWRLHKDARSFHHFILAFAVELGLFALFVRSVAFYLVPEIGDEVRFVGFIAYGGIAVCVTFLVFSWHRDRDRRG